jgi:hypothetical protein
MVAVLAASLATVVPSSAAAATSGRSATLSGQIGALDVPAGWYRIRNFLVPTRCLQPNLATAGSPGVFSEVYLAPCDNSPNQRWLFGPTHPSYPAQYREVMNAAGRCLDADNRAGGSPASSMSTRATGAGTRRGPSLIHSVSGARASG